MEVSILQHAKDTSPKAVGISEIVDLIRGDQWPPGYQPVMLVQGTFEGGTRQQNLTRLSGLSAAVDQAFIDQAFIDLGFKATVIDGMPGYLAIRRKPEEINALGRQLAQRTAQPHEAVKQDPEIPDHF